MSLQNDIETREALATGEAFVTTLHDVRMVRDRAVAAEREACIRILRQVPIAMNDGVGDGYSLHDVECYVELAVRAIQHRGAA